MQTAKAEKDCSKKNFNFFGRWRNQHGSEMNLTKFEDGKVSGTFRTGVGAHEPGEVHLLTGFVAGGLISFTVNFGKYDTLTSWTGQHNQIDGHDHIETMWHLARTIPENGRHDRLWAGVWTGSDTFNRIGDDSPLDHDISDRPMFIPSYPLKFSKK